MLARDRMVAVGKSDRRGKIEAEERTDAAGVDDKVVADRHAPLVQQFL